MELIRRCWAEVDLDQMEKNYRELRAKTEEKTLMMGVVKADAYGHGAVRCATLLQELGMDWFAVSNIAEAVQLRQGGITRPILILGYTPPECAGILAEENITQALYSSEYAAALTADAQRAGVTVDVHIKIDTGMGRIGFSPDSPEDMAAVCALKDNPQIEFNS